MRILVTVPSKLDKGGVTSYYQSIFPFFKNAGFPSLSVFEIGRTAFRYGILYPLMDHVRFYFRIRHRYYDLVHLNPSFTFNCFIREGILLYLAKKRKIPVLVFFRGWEYSFERTVGKLFFLFLKWTYKKADAFIVLGSCFKRKLRAWGIDAPVYRETTAVSAVLTDNFPVHFKNRRFWNLKKIKVLFLARVEREKGIFETIRAVQILLDKGYELSLTIAGDGPALHKIGQYIDTGGIREDAVIFLGHIDNSHKQEVLLSHHILCLPTYREGMPNAVLEAMACGLAIITRPEGGIPDFFMEGKMGYMVRSRDPSVIAEHLEKLIKNRERLSGMAYFNYKFARENFSAENVARRLSKIYSTIIQRSE